jgi:predicted membrane-bound spermidine synthase
MKLHEYFATGRPVVGPPIRSFLAFSDVVRLAGTPEQWSQVLTESLATDAKALAWVKVYLPRLILPITAALTPLVDFAIAFVIGACQRSPRFYSWL